MVKDSAGNIQGSIRIIKWDYKTKLPIQKLLTSILWILAALRMYPQYGILEDLQPIKPTRTAHCLKN
jgi:hypothetical protein